MAQKINIIRLDSLNQASLITRLSFISRSAYYIFRPQFFVTHFQPEKNSSIVCFGILQHFLKLWAVFNVLEESSTTAICSTSNSIQGRDRRDSSTSNNQQHISCAKYSAASVVPRWWSNNSSSSFFFFSRIPQPFTRVSATLVDSSRTRELAKYNKKDHPSLTLLVVISIFMDFEG